MRTQTLFEAGIGDYPIYRIPSIITLPSGRVIAFCEGRMDGMRDNGSIHILARVSEDGETFGAPFIAARDGEDTLNNPAPVYDCDTGVLWLLCNGNKRREDESAILHGGAGRSVLIARSDDGGSHWSELKDITASVKRPDWTWYAMGPCHAAQLASGRLIVPCNHAAGAGEAAGKYVSHAIYSDDHGQTWRIGGSVGADTNECALAELPDGRVYINMRSYAGQGCRAVAYSSDGGETWGALRLDKSLPDPVCQGSVLSLPNGELILSNAASATDREKLTVRRSRDGGETWSAGTVIFPGCAAYSDLTMLPDGRVACLYECGEQDAYARICLTALDLDEIV